MPLNHALLDEVKKKFTHYLNIKNLRKTTDRVAVLEEVYSQTGHFDIETLYKGMKAKDVHVSRATVYNTIDLLVECDLVSKHQFGTNQAHYEKSYGYRQHDHVICIKCNRVVEFCDPRIQNIQSKVSEILGFDILYHSLNLYGLCKDCKESANELKKEN